MRNFLINIHQLKTAGKTLEGVLYREYRDKLIYVTKLPPSSENVYISQMNKKIKNINIETKEAMTGHMFFGAHKYLKKRNYTYTTFLREPLDRARSYYFYMLRYPDMEISKIIKKNHISLSKFLLLDDNEIFNYGFNNRAKEEIKLIINNGQARTLIEYDENIDECLQEKVMQNINKNFLLLGTVEYFNESIMILCKYLNFKKNYFFLSTNKNNYKILDNDSLDIKTIDQFYENNNIDLKLHEYASTQINNELNNNKNYYLNEYSKLERRNKLNSLLRPLISKIKRRIRIL